MPYPAGLTVKKFALARPLADADKVISLAKMKTHTFMGVTGAAKNMFGFIVGMQKAQFHLRMQARQEFAAMLIDLACLVQPVLSIVDGVVGMEGDGPRNGKPVDAGVLLAGENCFAVDVVMAAIMGFAPERLPLAALALERGLTPPLAGIDLVGDASALRHAFVAPRSMKALSDRLPKWAAEVGRSQLTARPEIADTCIGCGRCAAHCPPQAMTVAGGKVRIDYDKCIRCYCCQELCPENAVRLREGRLLKAARKLF
jgi:ferredoxin